LIKATCLNGYRFVQLNTEYKI